MLPRMTSPGQSGFRGCTFKQRSSAFRSHARVPGARPEHYQQGHWKATSPQGADQKAIRRDPLPDGLKVGAGIPPALLLPPSFPPRIAHRQDHLPATCEVTVNKKLKPSRTVQSRKRRKTDTAVTVTYLPGREPEPPPDDICRSCFQQRSVTGVCGCDL